jgi:hypothetical protein
MVCVNLPIIFINFPPGSKYFLLVAKLGDKVSPNLGLGPRGRDGNI